jgi:nucleoside-diphosphate-sugar epimerase
MEKSFQTEDAQQFAERFEMVEDLRGKTFLITGATGLIGSVMVKCLLELNRQKNLGIKVIVVVRSLDKARKVFGDEYSQIEIYEMELSEITQEHIDSIVDYVVHLACPTASKYFVEHPVETLLTAIEGTKVVLEYVRLAGIKGMVYASSLEVYGSNHSDEWISEDFQGYVNPTEVRSSYNIGKRACECLCHSYAKEYDVNVTIARMTQTFGAGVDYNDGRVFAQFARKAIEGSDIELHTTGDTCRMYCYTTDAVSAMLYLLLKGKRGEAYNIANKDSYISIRDMAYLVKNEFNQNINVVVSPKENQGYAPETKLRLETSKVESLGWQPEYGLKEMFTRLIQSMRNGI